MVSPNPDHTLVLYFCLGFIAITLLVGPIEPMEPAVKSSFSADAVLKKHQPLCLEVQFLTATSTSQYDDYTTPKAMDYFPVVGVVEEEGEEEEKEKCPRGSFTCEFSPAAADSEGLGNNCARSPSDAWVGEKVGASVCAKCPAAGTGATAVDEDDTVQAVGSEVCKACAVGFFPFVGTTTCSECPGDSITNQVVCACPWGTYQENDGADTLCTLCSAKKFPDVLGATECASCGERSTSLARSETCSMCAAGYLSVFGSQGGVCLDGSAAPSHPQVAWADTFSTDKHQKATAGAMDVNQAVVLVAESSALSELEELLLVEFQDFQSTKLELETALAQLEASYTYTTGWWHCGSLVAAITIFCVWIRERLANAAKDRRESERAQRLRQGTRKMIELQRRKALRSAFTDWTVLPNPRKKDRRESQRAQRLSQGTRKISELQTRKALRLPFADWTVLPNPIKRSLQPQEDFWLTSKTFRATHAKWAQVRLDMAARLIRKCMRMANRQDMGEYPTHENPWNALTALACETLQHAEDFDPLIFDELYHRTREYYVEARRADSLGLRIMLVRLVTMP